MSVEFRIGDYAHNFKQNSVMLNYPVWDKQKHGQTSPEMK